MSFDLDQETPEKTLTELQKAVDRFSKDAKSLGKENGEPWEIISRELAKAVARIETERLKDKGQKADPWILF